MTVTAIPGAIRNRFLQLGIQTVLNTPVTPTRRVPWRGIPTYNPNLVDPDVDVGSLDPVLPPYATATDVAAPFTGPLDFDSGAIRLSAALKGGVSPSSSSTSRTWVYQVASLTQDVFDVYTVQQADDTEATDAITAYGGIIDVFEETMPEDGGAIQISDQWIFSNATLGQNATDSLTIDETPAWAFATDTAYYLDSAAGSIGITPMDGVHNSVLRITNNIDKKRFQNGSNTRFQLSGFSRGPRMIEFIITAAKTSQWIAERATFDDGTPRPDRFIKYNTTSPELAAVGIPFSYQRQAPVKLYDVTDTEVNNNAAIEFTYRANYNSSLAYAFRASLTNQLTALP